MTKKNVPGKFITLRNKPVRQYEELKKKLLLLQCLSDSDQNAYELKVLQGTMEQIRSRLTPRNQQVFQNNVEVHMQRIQLGLGQVGALTPFMAQKKA